MRRDWAPSANAAPIETVEGELDLRELGGALWRKRLWIIVPTILAALISFAVVNILTPRYRSEARVLIENRETSYSRPEIDRGNDRDRALVDPEAVQSQVQLVQSRDLARKVVYSLKLNERREFNSDSSAWIIFNTVLSLFGIARDPSKMSIEERVLERYYDRLSVYPIEKSRVIGIDFQSEDPEFAAKVANAIAAEYLILQQASKRDAMKQASAWLATEIDSLRGKVAEAEAKVEDFRGRSNLYVGNNNNQLSTQTLGELNTQIVAARAQKSDFEARARLIREMLKTGKPIEFTDVVNSELIRRLSEQRATLRAQLAEQSSTLLPLHPRIKELTAQINDLEFQIRSEADKLVRTIENDSRVSGARLENMMASLDQLKKQQSALGGQDVQLRAFEREAKAQRDLLESYLSRYRDVTARETPDAVPPDARIISAAVASSTPHFPKKLPIVLIVSAAVAMFATTLVAMGELLGGGVYRQPGSPEVFEARPEPLRVPANFAANPPPVQHQLAEFLARMRNLGHGIYLVGHTKNETSSGRIAVHFARDLAASGSRVLFLDLDAETAPSAALIAEPRVAGLSDLLSNAVTFTEVIQRDRASRIHVIGLGRTVRDSEQLLSADRLAIVLGALSQTYDYVIAATPALAGLRGADRLARFARSTALITAEGEESVGTAQSNVLASQGFANVIVISAASYTPTDTSGLAAA